MRRIKTVTVLVALAIFFAAVEILWASWVALFWKAQPHDDISPPISQSEQTENASVATKAYGYDRNTLDVAEYQISKEVKAAVEGKEGCSALGDRDDAYIPVAFNDGAPCGIFRKNGTTIVYGVGYSYPYEGITGLGAKIYVFKDDGFFIVDDIPTLPDLREFSAVHQQALEEFAKTHQTDFGAPDWNAYESLNRSFLRKELESPSPRVAEALWKLKAYAETLAP